MNIESDKRYAAGLALSLWGSWPSVPVHGFPRLQGFRRVLGFRSDARVPSDKTAPSDTRRPILQNCHHDEGFSPTRDLLSPASAGIFQRDTDLRNQTSREAAAMKLTRSVSPGSPQKYWQSREAATRDYLPISSRYFSTSSAAMQPVPAAVTAWRYRRSATSPLMKTPGTFEHT